MVTLRKLRYFLYHSFYMSKLQMYILDCLSTQHSRGSFYITLAGKVLPQLKGHLFV